MKRKILNALAVVTSLFGYLQWGTGNSMFLFQGEFQILSKLITDPVSAAHPFTVLPLLGQVMLIVTVFQQEPSKRLTYLGLACLGLLLLFMSLIGVLSLNYRILLSTLPFIISSVFAIREARKK